ncbi:MAG TPA: phosphatase PAP2 family protein [Rhizomicrobium sp.]
MTVRLQWLLLLILGSVIAADCLWASLARFDVDTGAYGLLALLASGLGLAGLFYARVRNDEHLSAMLFGSGFLIAFSASFSLLNYFLLTVAGPRIDVPLAAADRAMGIDWPAMMVLAANHPAANKALEFAYNSVLPQIVLLIACLGARSRAADIYRFSLALAVGAGITVFCWTAFPSFGAFSVYELPAAVSSRLTVALDGHYAHDLLALLANGPGRISPQEVKGLIGFPSFHAVLALLVAWYAWPLRRLRWPAVGLNAAVLVATPIQGGHHVVDVIAGFGVAAAAIAATGLLVRVALPVRSPPLATALSHLQSSAN